MDNLVEYVKSELEKKGISLDGFELIHSVEMMGTKILFFESRENNIVGEVFVNGDVTFCFYTPKRVNLENLFGDKAVDVKFNPDLDLGGIELL